MEHQNHRLLNIIISIGLVVTILTGMTLPLLDWGHEKKVEPVAKEKSELEYKIPKRLSATH